MQSTLIDSDIQASIKPQTDQSRRGLAILKSALLVGILGDAMLNSVQPGINVTIVFCVVIGVLAGFSRGRGDRDLLKGQNRYVLAAAIFFALAFAWRDSNLLQVLDFLGALACLSLLGLASRGSKLITSGVAKYIVAPVVAMASAGFSTLQLIFCDVDWQSMTSKRNGKKLLAFARGAAIAIPLVLVFGLLFMSADLVFAGLINSIPLHLDVLFQHLVIALCIAWPAAGFFRGALLGKVVSFTRPNKNEPTTPFDKISQTSAESDASQTVVQDKRPGRSTTEVGMVLGSMNILFLAFVGVQARYMFGGQSVISAIPGLTYAEYARQGFFQLVIVSLLVLPVLLIGHWLVEQGDEATKRLFNRLSLSLIVLLYFVMASALLRMMIYQREYGLTELRLYTSVFMVWLAAVFVWFIMTVLRGRREQFAWGAAAAGLVVMIALHAANPDALIVRTNIRHSTTRGQIFDAAYNANLSDDAVPELTSDLNLMTPSVRTSVSVFLLKNSEHESRDWRSFNVSRFLARRRINENRETLRIEADRQPVAPVEIETIPEPTSDPHIDRPKDISN